MNKYNELCVNNNSNVINTALFTYRKEREGKSQREK